MSVLVTLVLLMGGATARPAHGGTTASPAPAVSGNGSCPGPRESTSYTGTLAVEGGPLPTSAVDGIPIDLSYYQEVNVTYTLNDTPVSLNCVLVEVPSAAVTDGYGHFNGTIVPAADGCGSVYCTFYEAPFGPVSVTPEPTPAGYGLASSGTDPSFQLTWVAGLTTVTLAPGGPAVPFAPGSVRSFTATPWTANGSVSSLAPEFHWTLSGAGWSFSVPSNRSSVAVVAGPDAGTGVLSVSANATVGNNSFETPSVAVNLSCAATTIENGSLGRTVIDAGEPDPVSVTSLGAAGYDYRASFALGPGSPNESVNCTTVARSATVARVDCSATVTYSAPGAAELSVNVTNGYSNATWSSPPITVDPAPVLRATPATPIGYPGVALPIEVEAANGSGDPPYSVACFDPGVGPIQCSTSGGPNWTFRPTYPTVGSYSAIAWAIDAAGMNRSLAVGVTVVDPLSVGPLALSNASLEAGVPSNLSTVIGGGALPAEAWWNASDLSGPIRVEPLGEDGAASVSFVPPAAGSVTLSLTVRDALGETEGSSRTLAVDPGPTASVTALTPALLPPSVVGRPVALAWQARDALGETALGVGTSLDLVVENGSGILAPSWANVSHLGELSAAPEGSFAVPTSAWSAGTLALNLTPAVAGLLTIDLGGPGLRGSSVTLPVVAPDLIHLRLFAPEFAHYGNRVNRTFWHVSDRAGDPVPGAYLTLAYEGPKGTTNTLLPVGWVAPGVTGLWVNYSLPDEGSVLLLDAAGEVLVGPVSLAAPSTSAALRIGPPLGFVALPVALIAGVASASFVARTRRREVRVVLPNEEEEAHRFAEGRAEVIEVVRNAGAVDLATIAAAWEVERVPGDLDDWIRSLVADGTLIASSGADGGVTYSLAPTSPEPSSPRVTLDPEALERAVAAREAVAEEPREDST